MANPRFITRKWKREFSPEIAVSLADVVGKTMSDYSCLWGKQLWLERSQDNDFCSKITFLQTGILL
jgi:hypothetical protein